MHHKHRRSAGVLLAPTLSASVPNPGFPFGPPPPALFDRVAQQGLELDQLVGGHGGIDAWADLVAANG